MSNADTVAALAERIHQEWEDASFTGLSEITLWAGKDRRATQFSREFARWTAEIALAHIDGSEEPESYWERATKTALIDGHADG